MTTELAPVKDQPTGQMQIFNQQQLDLIKNTVMPGSTNDELELFVNICKRTGLDPFARQIYAVERRYKDNNNQWQKKFEFQTSVDGFRLIAERSGKYEGQTETEWCGPDGKWVNVWVKKEFPKAARVGVYKTGHREPTYAVARWESYVQTYFKNNQQQVGKMWAKMPDLMLAKCAECLALRKAFPNELSGMYAKEEMAQSENEPQGGESRPPQQKQIEQKTPGGLTMPQLKRTFAIAGEKNWSNDDIKSAMHQLVNKESTKELNKQEYDFLCDFFENNGPEAVEPPVESGQDYEAQHEVVNHATGEVWEPQDFPQGGD